MRSASVVRRASVALALALACVSPMRPAAAQERDHVRVRVVDPFGAPVRGVRLMVCAVRWPSRACEHALGSAVTAADGRAAMEWSDASGRIVDVQFVDPSHDGFVLLMRVIDHFDGRVPVEKDVAFRPFWVHHEPVVRARCAAFQAQDTTVRYTVVRGQCGMPVR